MKKVFCVFICIILMFSFLNVSTNAYSDDEIISILCITNHSNKSEKIEYLIHNNMLYVSKEDAALLSDRICDKNVENGFFLYFPGPQKQDDGSWKIIPNKFKGTTIVYENTNDIYIFNNKSYYPLKSIMDLLGTSYYYDSGSCSIMFFPSYTYFELIGIFKAYASSNYIVTSSETFDSALGKTGIVLATAYDVFTNGRFISVITNQYASEKYEDVLKEIIYPKLTSESSLVDIGKEGESIMDPISTLYKKNKDDPEVIELLCNALGYDAVGIIEAYGIMDDLLPGLSIGDFIKIIDLTKREYMGKTEYIKAMYYGLEAPVDQNINIARNHLLPDNLDHWTYENILNQAINDYVDRLKRKAIKDTCELITGLKFSYIKAISKITDIALNNFAPVGEAVKDCINLKYSGVLQQVAMKNVCKSAYPYEVKYSTVLYLLLSAYESKKVGMEECARVSDLLCQSALSLPDKGISKVNNQEIDIISLKSDYRRLELSGVESIALYHIAYMFSNSGEESIRMYYKDANSDGYEDLLIQFADSDYCSGIALGGTYDNTIQLCGSFTGEDTLAYSPIYGAYIRIVDDEEAPVKDYFYRIESYDVASDSWMLLFEVKYDENTDGLTRYFILEEEVSYSEYISVYDAMLSDLHDLSDYTNERGFDSFTINIDLSSQDIFEELMKYSVFDSSYFSDLNGDGEKDYVLISQLSETEMDDHKSRRVPNGIKEIGNGILPYFWDDACLYVLSNSGSASIKWSSFANLLGKLCDKELPLPDGVYDGSIENLSPEYARKNYLVIDTFDGSDVYVSTFGLIELENKFCDSLAEGDVINMEAFGYDTDIIVSRINEYGIGIDDHNSLGINSLYRPGNYVGGLLWDSEWIALGDSDWPVRWTQYDGYMPLSDEIEIEYYYPYYFEGETHIQIIELTDLNDCLDYLRTGFTDGTEITISDGKITKIRLYSTALDREISTNIISIHYNENPQWFSLTYDQMDERIMEHVKAIQSRYITMYEQTREVKYADHTYSVGIAYHLTDEDFGEEGYVNGNPIKLMGRVTVDLETGEAHYKDEWGLEDYWNIY